MYQIKLLKLYKIFWLKYYQIITFNLLTKKKLIVLFNNIYLNITLLINNDFNLLNTVKIK